jgi:hypothetical protein
VQLQVVERKLHQMRLVARLEDADRLDALLEMLELKVPDRGHLHPFPHAKPKAIKAMATALRPKSAHVGGHASKKAGGGGPALSAFKAVGGAVSAPPLSKARSAGGVVVKKFMSPEGHVSSQGTEECGSDVDSIKAAVDALEGRVAALGLPGLDARPT